MHWKSATVLCLISSFQCEADENHALLGYYMAGNGNSLPTFQDNQMVLQGCLEKLVWNYHKFNVLFTMHHDIYFNYLMLFNIIWNFTDNKMFYAFNDYVYILK